MSSFAGGVTGFNGGWIDGAGTAAAFNVPSGVAVDASGNVLVADMFNHRLRRVTPSGGMQSAMQYRWDEEHQEKHNEVYPEDEKWFSSSIYFVASYAARCFSFSSGVYFGWWWRGHQRRLGGRRGCRGRLQHSYRCCGGRVWQRPGGGHDEPSRAARDAQRRYAAADLVGEFKGARVVGVVFLSCAFAIFCCWTLFLC